MVLRYFFCLDAERFEKYREKPECELWPVVHQYCEPYSKVRDSMFHEKLTVFLTVLFVIVIAFVSFEYRSVITILCCFLLLFLTRSPVCR